MSDRAKTATTPSGLRLRPWNLLLLVPFLTLAVPLFNSIEPKLFGLPFFYWAQFAFVPVGVVCVAIVYVTTRTEREVSPAGPRDVDALDESTAGDGAAKGAGK
ncbi:MAG TPA: DUF3311 domain-containing protein [Pseudonocardia sp.]|jgi:hypothetical protein